MQSRLTSVLGRLAPVLTIAAAAPAFAQTNLVPNPSFETFSSCPTTSDQVNRATGWVDPTNATPDYHNACHTGPIVGVPTNIFGTQAARTGKAYMHIFTAVKNASNYREYIQCQLTSPLVNGVTYDVSFYVSRAEGKIAVAQVGAYFSTSAISLTNSSAFNLVPQVENPGTNIITDTVNWVQVSGSFVASGGEQYLTLGNFRTPANTNKAPAPGGHQGGDYYLDDVSVIARKPAGCNSQLIGWADLPAPTTIGFLDVQDFEDNCKPARTQCTTLIPVRANAPYSGGTAYDQRYRTVWVSDGSILAEYYTVAQRACRARCPAQRAILASRTARVSGLAFGDKRKVLYQLATSPGYYEITMYDASGRCLGKTKTCRGTLPTGALAAGLAYDELRDLLYVSVDIPVSTGGYTHLLYVHLGGDPCRAICKSQLQSCTRRLTTGLAYDSCNQTLYATDGQTTQSYVVADPRRCQFKNAKCCKKQTKPIWRGLAILPCNEKKSIGKSCTTAPCPRCPSMTASCIGDAAFGSQFPVTLSGAPAPAFAILYLKLGPCGSGVPLPRPFCGTFYPFPVIASFPAQFMTSPVSCGGRAVTNIPILPDRRLCGQAFCAQWFVFCSVQNRFGLGFSNAIEFKVVGS